MKNGAEERGYSGVTVVMIGFMMTGNVSIRTAGGACSVEPSNRHNHRNEVNSEQTDDSIFRVPIRRTLVLVV